MHYVTQLKADHEATKAVAREALAQLVELQTYLLSAKFAAPDGDYVHVRTDLLPKLSAIRSTLSGVE